MEWTGGGFIFEQIKTLTTNISSALAFVPKELSGVAYSQG